MPQEDPPEIIAAHEAGHLVVALALGRHAEYATIGSPKEGKAGGVRTFPLPKGLTKAQGSYTEDEEELIADHVRTMIGGPLAESMVAEDRSYEEALDLNARNEESDKFAIVGWADALHSEDYPDRTAADAWHEQRRQEVADILKRQDAAWRALRAELLAKGELSESEIRAVFEAHS
jgi:ATP-dependent Zn protease